MLARSQAILRLLLDILQNFSNRLKKVHCLKLLKRDSMGLKGSHIKAILQAIPSFLTSAQEL